MLQQKWDSAAQVRWLCVIGQQFLLCVFLFLIATFSNISKADGDLQSHPRYIRPAPPEAPAIPKGWRDYIRGDSCMVASCMHLVPHFESYMSHWYTCPYATKYMRMKHAHICLMLTSESALFSVLLLHLSAID